MSLPEPNIPWPPEQFATLFRETRTDDAWYSGDRERLAELYSNALRRLDGRRRLWARRPAQPGRPDPRLHVPLAADIATTSADLLFSEPPTFTVEDTATQARLDELVDAGPIANTLQEAAEVAAALGGVFLRVSTWPPPSPSPRAYRSLWSPRPCGTPPCRPPRTSTATSPNRPHAKPSTPSTAPSPRPRPPAFEPTGRPCRDHHATTSSASAKPSAGWASLPRPPSAPP
ncbi:phage portal protein [Streptomyces sp. NBC_00649]|uniref:phage portal protein n=1 Tax=Streptomyces sp. NBC_00649 TaxID=2975798 RepID=UPI00324A2353